MTDPIVDEVRRVREAHAAKFNHDLDAIFQDIKDEEKNSGRKLVSYPPRLVEKPNQTPHPTGAATSFSTGSMVDEAARAAELEPNSSK